jgi:hypothetical protein
MNSETKIVTKMIYTQGLCHHLMTLDYTRPAWATIEWLHERAEEVMKEILCCQPIKIARSWARVADRAIERIRSLKDENIWDAPGQHDYAEEILYTISILTQMLEDASESDKAALIEDMRVAAYTLEEVLGLAKKKKSEAIYMREDEVRIAAKTFVERIYQKMNQE